MSLVMVVEDDTVTRAILVRTLANVPGASVIGAASVAESRLLLEATRPDVVVVDLELSDGLGLEVLQALDETGGVSTSFVVSSFLERYSDRLPEGEGRLHCLSKPVDPARLRDLVAQAMPTHETVNSPFAPAEYVQLAGLSGQRVVLRCTDAAGQPLGSVYVCDSRVWHAETNESHGFDALRTIVTHEGARVCAAPWVNDAPVGSINQDWQHVLLEAFTRHDERQRDEGACRSPTKTSQVSLRAPPSIRALSEPAADLEVGRLVDDAVRAVVRQDYPKAIAGLERALKARPNDPALRHRLRRLYQLQSKRTAS